MGVLYRLSYLGSFIIIVNISIIESLAVMPSLLLDSDEVKLFEAWKKTAFFATEKLLKSE